MGGPASTPVAGSPCAAGAWHSESRHGPSQHRHVDVDERRVVRVGDGLHVRAAYRSKYRGYAGSIVDGITDARARSTTLRLVPPAESS